MTEDKPLPTTKDLFFGTYLYAPIDLSQLDDQAQKAYIYTIIYSSDGYDCYCLQCGQTSYFTQTRKPQLMTVGQAEFQKAWQQKQRALEEIKKLEPSGTRRGQLSQQEQQSLQSWKTSLHRSEATEKAIPFDDILFSVELSCARDPNHIMAFVFRIQNSQLEKIGQTPSIADISNPEIRKYKKLLGEDQFREFSKAIGLASHGIGVGSFVYLRRIFENLVEAAHQAAQAASSWSEEEYLKERIQGKIKLLVDYLPSFLVSNLNLYGILSKGVHELTEDECLEAFDAVKLGIEMILDEKLRETERIQKEMEAKRALQALTEKHKSVQ